MFSIVIATDTPLTHPVHFKVLKVADALADVLGDASLEADSLPLPKVGGGLDSVGKLSSVLRVWVSSRISGYHSLEKK